MAKPFDWTERINRAIKLSGMSAETFAAQSDQELLRYPAFGRKTVEFFRRKYGGPPLNPGLASFSDTDLWTELRLRRDREKRLTDHG